LKIAYLHYHLKLGGVTTVLRRQVQSLPPGTGAVVLSGEPSPDAFPAPVITVPGIGYDGTPGTEKPADTIAQSIDHRINGHFGGNGKCDLIHIHNPTLAKNSQFLDILHHLQQRGYQLLLQIHDFAEDGRPSVYYRDTPYPANCHYSVINRRDYNLLLSSGLKPEGLHYLPNCIAMDYSPAQVGGGGDYVLFPVRAIRRKNIGEALLLSLFLPLDCPIYITLPPNSPPDFPSYHHWRHLVHDCRLPVRFEMGLRKDFPTLLQQARHVVSTSISEGFGFTFLEPWVAGQNLEGRIIPAICRDFSEAGIRLDHLYPRLDIPVEWIGRAKLLDRFQACYRHNRRIYGFAAQMPSAQAFTAPLLKAATIDFGLIDEPLQRLVIQSVLANPGRRKQLLHLNPRINRMGRKPPSSQRILHNRELIAKAYDQATYGERLRAIYRHVRRLSVRQHIDKFKLVHGFMQLSNFSLLKWNPYREEH
jgi:hypothetical protein